MHHLQALQKGLTNQIDKAVGAGLEQMFMERALNCLWRASQATAGSAATIAAKPQPAEWVLTSWEIDMGPVIAHGGFAEVLKATWLNHTTVAVKRLHVRLETNKMREEFLREVKAWYPLRHPHILPLLGACATAERPFMVSPFMKFGHALQYLDWRTNTFGNESIESFGIKLLYEASLGMQYLHSRGVVHGDLKAVNILVDEHGNANIADFGFASLKQLTSTRNTKGVEANRNHFGGTLRWMSPERLSGGSLTPSVDVYAFAMTCYEVLSDGEVPLTDIPDALLFQLVVHNHRRPALPITSAGTMYKHSAKPMYQMMKASWDPNPLNRPTFSSIALTMKSIVCEVPGSTKMDLPHSSVTRDILFNPLHSQQPQQTTQYLPDSQVHDTPEFNDTINFEPGTWGQLMNDLLPIFLPYHQKDIKQGIFMFGKELTDPICEIQGSGELQSFLYNVKIAAGMETSSVRFIEFMHSKSATKADQQLKTSIHVALTTLGSKTRFLLPNGKTSPGLFGSLSQTLKALYHSPISLLIQDSRKSSNYVLSQNSDATILPMGTANISSTSSNLSF
ncbi:kinase-like domain-containing protein [Chytriomyces sp. MP71]|nr:kinase-like domain-containing protein [Chytriomyces sp. MP71]